MTAIGVTGATGRLGGRIARQLEHSGAQQRLLIRDPSRAPRLVGASLAVAEYGDADTVTEALAGLDTVLMVSATETPDRMERHRSFVEAAARAGIRHLIYVSFFGASATATFTLARDHWATEEHIKDSGMNYTFLRDNIYADLLPGMADKEGVLRGPAGQGRVAAVAQDDIAQVAAIVLQDPEGHVGQTYNLTGPEALTLDQVADTITRLTGRTVRYQPETVKEANASRRASASSPWRLEAWVSTYTAIAAGELDGVTNDVEKLTGCPATSLTHLLHQLFS
jgi:NAD(P)H dehydrogenase (quinone)